MSKNVDFLRPVPNRLRRWRIRSTARIYPLVPVLPVQPDHRRIGGSQGRMSSSKPCMTKRCHTKGKLWLNP